MQVTETKVYEFSELSKEAQQKAIAWFLAGSIAQDWFESTYDDAAQVGIEITEFDTDRGNMIKGKFLASAEESAHKIVDNHGENCETYKTAKEYLENRDKTIDAASKDEDSELESEYELDGELDTLDAEFLKSILEDYLSMLKTEYEYITSEEYAREGIIANEYTFTEDGKRFG